MHKIHSLKSDRNVRIAGSDKVYFYTINLGQKCESHRGMDFSLHCSRVHHISTQWALLGISLDNKATACLSLVSVLRISAVLKMLDQNVLSTYPEHGCSKLLLHVSTACTQSYSKRLQSSFTSTTVRNPDLIIVLSYPHFYVYTAWCCGKRHFILILQEHV